MIVTPIMLVLAIDSDVYYRALVLAVAAHYEISPATAEHWIALRGQVLAARH